MNGDMYGWIKNESREPIHSTLKMKTFYMEGRLLKLTNVDGFSISVENDKKKQCRQGTLMRQQWEKHYKKRVWGRYNN